MRDHDALGTPRGARGVDHVAQVLGREIRDGRVGRGQGRPRSRTGVDLDDRHGTLRERPASGPVQGSLRQQGRRGAVLQHHAQPGRRRGGIEGHVRTARLEDGEHAHHHLQAGFHADGHPDLRPHAPGREGVRQPVRPFVELRVAQRPAFAACRHGVRGALHLCLEQLVDAGAAGILRGRRIPLAHQHASLRLAEHIQLREAGIGVRGELLQHPAQVRQHSPDGAPVEQLRAVSDDHRQAFRTLPERQVEVELDGVRVAGQRVQAQARQAESVAFLVPLREHHLEERRVAEAPLGLQLRHEPVERHLLVLVCAQRHLPHAPQDVAQGRIPGKVRPQDQRVHEEADQLLDIAPRSAGDRGSHHHVLAPAVLREQRLERAEHHHVERRAFPMAQRLQPAREVTGKLRLLVRAPVRLHLRARAVRRQLQERGDSGKPGPPVGELPLQGFTAQLPALVGHVVRVPHRRLGERRSPSFAERPVEGRQLAEEHPHAPLVGDDVVDAQQQHVVLFTQSQQSRPEERARREVEGPPRPVEDLSPHLRLARRLGGAREILYRQREAPEGRDDLHGSPFALLERGPQRLVPPDDLPQRALQGRTVQRAAQPERVGQVVEGAPRMQAVQEPEPLLRERHRLGAWPADPLGQDPPEELLFFAAGQSGDGRGRRGHSGAILRLGSSGGGPARRPRAHRAPGAGGTDWKRSSPARRPRPGDRRSGASASSGRAPRRWGPRESRAR